MQTDEDIILTINELPPEKKRIVIDYINAVKEESFKVTHYSPEVMVEIDRDAEEAKRGENVYGPFKGKEAIDFLTELEK
jgi:hypothetical protein